MPLTKIALPQREFTFSDGQSVFLKSPTLLQIQNAQKQSRGDEVEQVKILLVEMSDGELNKDFLNSLPIGEWGELAKAVGDFMGIDVKN
ncbi:MAG: hypothetical protein ACTTJC_02210 [Campylobacter sp.]